MYTMNSRQPLPGYARFLLGMLVFFMLMAAGLLGMFWHLRPDSAPEVGFLGAGALIALLFAWALWTLVRDLRNPNTRLRLAIDLVQPERKPGLRLKYAEQAIANGADVNLKYASLQTPLIRSIQRKATAISDLLIRKGADIRATDKMGLSALDMAQISLELKTIEQLLDSGVDPNAVNEAGVGPLAFAIAMMRPGMPGTDAEKVEIVRTLLDRGAEPAAGQFEGKGCTDLARELPGTLSSTVLNLLERNEPDGTTRPLQPASLETGANSSEVLTSEGRKGKSNWYWPAIVDLESARAATQSGFWAAGIVAGVTAILATIAVVFGNEIGGFSAWAYIDAVAFGIIAWRVKRFSRVFALAGIALFVFERIVAAQSQSTAGWGVAALLLLGFVNGARGVFAYHRYSKIPTTK